MNDKNLESLSEGISRIIDESGVMNMPHYHFMFIQHTKPLRPEDEFNTK